MKSINNYTIYIILIIFFHSNILHSNEKNSTLTIQSTTSTRDSGFYDYIMPFFHKKFNIKTKVISVGTGQAINNARNCDGDILIVHSKQDEEDFINKGYGVERKNLMYNDFVIIGPKHDPLKLKDSISLQRVILEILQGSEKFISRGDDSGTHKAEIRIWTNVQKDFDNFKKNNLYLETGQGMGATLNIAIGLNAYTFADRATWINFKNKQNHIIIYENDSLLKNQYGIIMVSNKKCKNINTKSSRIFYDWILSSEGKKIIDSYRIRNYQLFFTD